MKALIRVTAMWTFIAVLAGLGFALGEDLYYALTGLVGICRG
jgi:RsiW-degrading membrane proteinase PrsW (M82 family)